MDYKQLGKRIRTERQNLNLTQEKLAEKVEVSEAYVGQIERGERNLALDTLVRLANSLGVTVDYLLKDSIEVDEDHSFHHLKQLLVNRTPKERQMALDVIKMMYAHLDDMNVGE